MKKVLSLLLVFVGAFTILGQGLTIRSAFYLPSIKSAAGGGAATYSLIAHAIATAVSSDPATTSDIDTSTANLIVIGVMNYNTDPTVSDNKSNTWTPLNHPPTPNGTHSNLLYYCINPTVGANHNFTVTANYSVCSVAAFKLSSGTPSLDNQSGNGTASGSTLAPGSVTPAGNNELFVTACDWSDGAATASINSSFSILDQAEVNAAIAGGLAYKIQTSGGAENPTWTVTANNVITATMAVFK